MNALQELIHTRMSELNRSYGDIARRGGLPRSTVYHLASNNRPVRVPNPRTLERLAIGLEVPEHVVRAAAAAAAGFVLDEQPADDPEIEVLIASLAKLSAEERKHVSALVRSMLDAADRGIAEPKVLPLGNELVSPFGCRALAAGGSSVLGWVPDPDPPSILRKENEMRIIRFTALPAVVRVKGRGLCAVAIPDNLPSREVLELASLVLSTPEYEEFRDAVEPDADPELPGRPGCGPLRKP